MPGVHYGIRQGDRVAMIEQHHEPGAERIENGSHGEVLDVTPGGEALIEFDITGRQRTLAGEDLDRVRLGYAQHIHRAQGATVTRTLVVTGGWQTSKEPAYVEASRARKGTDWYVSREDLGVEGHDTDRIQRLAAQHAPQPRANPIARAPRAPRPRLRAAASTTRSRPAAQPATGDRPRHQPHRPTITNTGANTMSHKLQIVLPDPVALQLQELAAGADTPPSTLAGQIVRNGVALAAKDGKVRPLRPAPVLVGGKGSERAPWLEPYGGDANWRTADVGPDRRATRPLPPRPRHAQRRLVDRRLTHRDTLRARRMASRNRRHGPRPPRRARLPKPAHRLRPHSYASKAAASPRHGNPARHPPSGREKNGHTIALTQPTILLRGLIRDRPRSCRRRSRIGSRGALPARRGRVPTPTLPRTSPERRSRWRTSWIVNGWRLLRSRWRCIVGDVTLRCHRQL